MKKVSAVIGANYGDEGKGHVVDWLATPKSLVIRFNGGAQAGHTVVTPDDRRHVFHHFGSGTLQDAATFLSKHFIVNPIIFVEELQKLKELKVAPWVIVDPECLVTTPYDMMLNQALESKRGSGRHGSCGLGINETIVRSLNPEFKLQVRDLYDSVKLVDKLADIQYKYVPTRMNELELETIEHLHSPGIRVHFVEDINRFLGTVEIHPWGPSEASPFEDIIFEGAQGLRLDELSPDFPHVTRSRTGLPNVVSLMKEAELESLCVYYPSRPYLTRHGAGPLPNEQALTPPKFEDKTNVPNPHQGVLRFAPMNVERLVADIRNDIENLKNTNISACSSVVWTCIDQLQDEMVHWYKRGGDKMYTPVYHLAAEVRLLVNMHRPLFASGPTRDQIWY
jgi:adenylosuccinate synthase